MFLLSRTEIKSEVIVYRNREWKQNLFKIKGHLIWIRSLFIKKVPDEHSFIASGFKDTKPNHTIIFRLIPFLTWKVLKIGFKPNLLWYNWFNKLTLAFNSFFLVKVKYICRSINDSTHKTPSYRRGSQLILILIIPNILRTFRDPINKIRYFHK